VIQLGTPADITNFEVGMKIDLASTDGTTGSKRANGPLTITAVNRITGTITCSANINTITGAANTDWIFRNGDLETTRQMAFGTDAWAPQADPTGGDNFFGVDRSVDPTRLAGVRFNGNGGDKIETLIDAAELTGREGADDLTCFINNLDRSEIAKALQGKAIYEPVKSTDGQFSYRALLLEGPDGPIKLISDVNVQKGRFWMLQMDTWVMKSIKGAPRILDDDGLKMLRESSSDGYEWRLGAYWQPGCEAPGYNCAGTF
jgi:hypothetical protein